MIVHQLSVFLENKAGRLTEVLGKQRVKVEIESIRQSLFVKIPLGILEIIGDDKEEEIRYW